MLGDTIVALASAPGGSERAVLRISGPAAFAAAALVFAPALTRVRSVVDGQVFLPAIELPAIELPAMALVMPGPRSFTGEDVVELHVPGSPLLVELLLDRLLADGGVSGVRRALPGEFTARAVQNGKLDAAAVEGLLMLLHAQDERAAAAALPWLRGGFRDVVQRLRSDLQEALALLEVGLDFTDGETGAVPAAVWQVPLAATATGLLELLQQVPLVAAGGDAVLFGVANAGKSALVNALLGGERALVSNVPGTTRDSLRFELGPGVAIVDAPGDLDAPLGIDAAALALRDELAGGAASALLVLDASAARTPPSALRSPLPWRALVWTKCDLAPPPPVPPEVGERARGLPTFATSALTGVGIPGLRDYLLAQPGGGVIDAGGPLRSALRGSHEALVRAIAAPSPELAAVDLQQALRALDGIAGRHSPEALLDRIYGRFCLGK
jgi:tRNA modification GTPase